MLIVGAVILQQRDFLRLESGVVPDWILIITIFFSLRKEELVGMIIGFIGGFFMDAISGVIQGVHMFAKTITAFIVGEMKNRIFAETIWSIMIIVALVSLMHGSIVLVLEYIFHQPFPLFQKILHYTIPEVLYNTVIAVPVFFILNYVMERIDRRKEID